MEKSTVNIFNDILDSDILTYLLKDSKMDLDGVRLKIAYMKNQEILQNHPIRNLAGKEWTLVYPCAGRYKTRRKEKDSKKHP